MYGVERGYLAGMGSDGPRDLGASVCVFSPTPLLTVAIEGSDNSSDVHLHGGGQGLWVANMLAVLGTNVAFCGPFGGETGQVIQSLIDRKHVHVQGVDTRGSNGCYVEDRRGGRRSRIAEVAPTVLNRHELDDLFNQLLAAALTSRITVLTGPAHQGVIPPDAYSRVVGNLSALDVIVAADLAGDMLGAALEGGLSVLKVSHEELLEDGRTPSDSIEHLAQAMDSLSERVDRMVVVTRADEPALAMVEGRAVEIHVPKLQPVHHRGAGDSMTAGIAAALARGDGLDDALRLGAAAGVVNVTRHGLASGHRETVEQIAERVLLKPMTSSRGGQS